MLKEKLAVSDGEDTFDRLFSGVLSLIESTGVYGAVLSPYGSGGRLSFGSEMSGSYCLIDYSDFKMLSNALSPSGNRLKRSVIAPYGCLGRFDIDERIADVLVLYCGDKTLIRVVGYQESGLPFKRLKFEDYNIEVAMEYLESFDISNLWSVLD